MQRRIRRRRYRLALRGCKAFRPLSRRESLVRTDVRQSLRTYAAIAGRQRTCACSRHSAGMFEKHYLQKSADRWRIGRAPQPFTAHIASEARGGRVQLPGCDRGLAQSTRQGIARQYRTEYRRHRRARRIFGCLQLPQGFQTLDEQDASRIPKRCRLARSHRPIAWTPPTPFRSGEPDERRRHRAALLVFTVVQWPILAETCESRSAPWHWLARLRG